MRSLILAGLCLGVVLSIYVGYETGEWVPVSIYTVGLAIVLDRQIRDDVRR